MSKVYHFIGIKGSGMSALALMLHQMGHKVQGSDVEKYYFTQRGLEQAGIPIFPFDVRHQGQRISFDKLSKCLAAVPEWPPNEE